MIALKRLAVTFILAAAAIFTVLALPHQTQANWREAGPAGAAAGSVSRQPDGVAPAIVPATIPPQALRLTYRGARLPEIAANNTYVAMVYQFGNGSGSRVFIRAATAAGWGLSIPVDSRRGEVPRLAFVPGENKVHVVWEAEDGLNIRHTICTLAEILPACAPSAELAPGNIIAQRYRLPDIVVDAGKQAHVAWLDRNGAANQSDNQVRVARRPANSSSWTVSTLPLAGSFVKGGDDAGQTALAVNGDFVHLALIERGRRTLADRWSIEYWRYQISNGNWTNPKFYANDEQVQFFDGKIWNPAIAATGSSVYMTWDSQHKTELTWFGLIGAVSDNNGLAASWSAIPVHIPSKTAADDLTGALRQISYGATGATPVEERALRPSLTVSRTTGIYAVVWQQHFEEGCIYGPSEEQVLVNGTSEISYSLNSNDWAADKGWLDNNKAQFSIDPDIAVDANGTHVVYMKAPNNPADSLCPGGGAGDYLIYYQGPYQIDLIKPVHLPVITKS